MEGRSPIAYAVSPLALPHHFALLLALLHYSCPHAQWEYSMDMVWIRYRVVAFELRTIDSIDYVTYYVVYNIYVRTKFVRRSISSVWVPGWCTVLCCYYCQVWSTAPIPGRTMSHNIRDTSKYVKNYTINFSVLNFSFATCASIIGSVYAIIPGLLGGSAFSMIHQGVPEHALGWL